MNTFILWQDLGKMCSSHSEQPHGAYSPHPTDEFMKLEDQRTCLRSASEDVLHASSDVKAISEYSWLLNSLSRGGAPFNPFPSPVACQHMSVYCHCPGLIWAATLLQYPGYSFSVTSGRLSLTTDFLFQCLLESFTPCLLLCRSYVVGVSIWAAHISYSLYSDQLLFSVKISVCCRGKPL